MLVSKQNRCLFFLPFPFFNDFLFFIQFKKVQIQRYSIAHCLIDWDVSGECVCASASASVVGRACIMILAIDYNLFYFVGDLILPWYYTHWSCPFVCNCAFFWWFLMTMLWLLCSGDNDNDLTNYFYETEILFLLFNFYFFLRPGLFLIDSVY